MDVSPKQRYAMNVWGVAAIGIGSMVGAGIFALLGQVALIAGLNVALSFLLAGLVALFSGYSYAKLAARYPTSGGILDYYNHAFTSPTVAGGLSLVYLITLGVSIAMIAKAFGAYAAGLIPNAGNNLWVINGLASAVVVGLTILNIMGSKAVGRVENLIVALKLIIMAVLMLAAMPTLDISRIESQHTTGDMALFSSMGLTFFAFAGFGMMTNAAGDVKNPKKTIPRAIFLAITTVILLYMVLAFVVLGNLSAAEIKLYTNTAVAEAARPVLGTAGFVVVSIAALLATASAINANLFSASRIADAMAQRKQLPALFAHSIGNDGSPGLLWSVGAILILTNLFDLRAIASIASTTFLICYLAVFIANWILRRQTVSSGVMIAVGFVFMLVILTSFVVSLSQENPLALALALAFLVLGLGVEAVMVHTIRKKKG